MTGKMEKKKDYLHVSAISAIKNLRSFFTVESPSLIQRHVSQEKALKKE